VSEYVCRSCKETKERTNYGPGLFRDLDGKKLQGTLCNQCRRVSRRVLVRKKTEPYIRRSKSPKITQPCKECSVVFDTFPGPKEYRLYTNGKYASGRVCYDCSLIIAERRNRLKGISSIDDTANPIHRKGRDAEVLVYNFFKDLGCEARITKKYGPDVSYKSGDKWVTVEVKSVSRRTKGCLTVTPVVQSQLGCDLIAYVKDKSVFIRSMKEHISLSGGGRFAVTKLFKESSW